VQEDGDRAQEGRKQQENGQESIPLGQTNEKKALHPAINQKAMILQRTPPNHAK